MLQEQLRFVAARETMPMKYSMRRRNANWPELESQAENIQEQRKYSHKKCDITVYALKWTWHNLELNKDFKAE